MKAPLVLIGLNNIAPTELNKSPVKLFYYDVTPMEQNVTVKTHMDQLVYQLYDLTEEEIKIIESNE